MRKDITPCSFIFGTKHSWSALAPFAQPSAIPSCVLCALVSLFY